MTAGMIRIIGGKWRGRRIKVPNEVGLRPTPDRVRETLFNWLSPYLVASHCLDMFAGSGVLGFEALSRGASRVTLVDASLSVVKMLRQSAELLNAAVEIYQAKAPYELKKPETPYDIIFLDPPYGSSLLAMSCDFLTKNTGFLAKEAYIYLESDQEFTDNHLPSHWLMVKKAKAGQVYFHLIKTREAAHI